MHGANDIRVCIGSLKLQHEVIRMHAANASMMHMISEARFTGQATFIHKTILSCKTAVKHMPPSLFEGLSARISSRSVSLVSDSAL